MKFKDLIYILLPTIVGLALLFLFFCFKIDYNVAGFGDVLNSVITFSSIIIGFYTAMYGILLTLKNTDIFIKFRQFNVDNIFKFQLYESLTVSFVILILSICLQVLINYDFLLSSILFYTWGFFVGYFLTSSFKTIQLLLKIMFKHDQGHKETTKNNISSKEREEIKNNLKK